jgi:hypothetical protein
LEVGFLLSFEALPILRQSFRWIFILEGILTVLVAVGAFFVIEDFPETASFLTAEERAFVIYRLKYQGNVSSDVNQAQVAQAEEFQWKYIKAAFLDPQIWGSIVVYWGVSHPMPHQVLS